MGLGATGEGDGVKHDTGIYQTNPGFWVDGQGKPEVTDGTRPEVLKELGVGAKLTVQGSPRDRNRFIKGV